MSNNSLTEIPGLLHSADMVGLPQLDVFSRAGLSTNTRKLLSDMISPYKIQLLVVLDAHCQMMSVPSPFYSDKAECEFLYSLLDLLLGPDLTLVQLLKKLKHGHPNLINNVVKSLHELCSGGLDELCSLMETIQQRMFSKSSHMGGSNMTRSSVAGKFVRSVCIAFEKLEFSLVTKLLNELQAEFKQQSEMIDLEKLQAACKNKKHEDVYNEPCIIYKSLSPGVSDSNSDSNLNETASGSSRSMDSNRGTSAKYSERQADYYIFEQAKLLQYNPSEALNSVQLDKKIKEFLSVNPDLAEAHFLSFMNHMRSREYCSAIDDHFHYFDQCHIQSMRAPRPSSDESKKNTEQELRGYRYAALNLAALQYHFGHRKEAVSSIREAIRMAQQSNDPVCLQHALGWLQRLGAQDDMGFEVMLERLINATSELNLPYLTSLGVQAIAKNSAIASIDPSLIFDFLLKSELSNATITVSPGSTDLTPESYSHRAALWNIYGRDDMCLLSCQMLLHLDCTTDASRIHRNTESECLALCHLARIHADRGLYSASYDILKSARLRFPQSSQYSHLWMFCSQVLEFTRARLRLRVKEAETAISGIASIDDQEARYCSGLLLVDQGRLSEAIDISDRFISQLNATPRITQHLLVRFLLLKAEALCSCGSAAASIIILLEALAICRKFHYTHLRSLVYLNLAFAQYVMGQYRQSLSLINVAMTTMTVHGTVFDRARAEFLYVRCRMAIIAREKSIHRINEMLELAGTADHLLELFRSVEARQHEMSVLYFQSQLYNEVGDTTKRNNCAQLYKQISVYLPVYRTSSSSICSLSSLLP